MMVVSLKFLMACFALMFWSVAASADDAEANLQAALGIQAAAIEDPLFEEVLRELDQEGSIRWRENNLRPHRRNDRARATKSVEWLLGKYSKEGLATAQNVKIKRGLGNPDTNAITGACSDKIKLRHSNTANRDAIAIANTLIHERVHSFCFQHISHVNQLRITLMCDLSYIAGDLAEAILARQAGQTDRKFADTSVCAPLCDALERRGMQICNRQDYKVHEVLPHDRRSWTQGLVFYEGKLFESTGKRGRSKIRELDPKTGGVLQSVRLHSRYFGEGLTPLADKLISITWEGMNGFIWEPSNLAVGPEEFQFQGTRENQGWGLTHDGESLIMSDGSHYLRYFDPQSIDQAAVLAPTKSIGVTFKGRPLCRLNELEFVDGKIFANLFQRNHLVRIDPSTGQVDGIVDLTDIAENVLPKNNPNAMMNGISYDENQRMFYLTGKLSHSLLRLQLNPRSVSDLTESDLKSPLDLDQICKSLP